MEEKIPRYTTIIHKVRIDLNLSCNEYCVADIIFSLSNNPKNIAKGWCYASKKTIGDCLGLSQPPVFEIIKRLIELDLVEKDENTKCLRTTSKWYDSVVMKKIAYKETLHTIKKLDSDYKKSLCPPIRKPYTDYKESLYNINKDNNKENKENKREEAKPSFANPQINETINLFKGINPTINFGNRTTRKAAEDLIKQFGYEKTKTIALYAVSVFGKQYAPTITTPYQLKEKLSQLMSYKLREDEKFSGSIPV